MKTESYIFILEVLCCIFCFVFAEISLCLVLKCIGLMHILYMLSTASQLPLLLFLFLTSIK